MTMKTMINLTTAMKRMAILFVVAMPAAVGARADVGDTFESDGLKYCITSETDRTVEVTHGDEHVSGEVIIPALVTRNDTRYAVTAIGDAAFISCMELTEISIPESVTSIGNSAFWYCCGLKSVTIPPFVTNIEGFAFFYCQGLTEVTIPKSVSFIGEQAFAGCSSMTDIYVEDGNEYYSSVSGVLYDSRQTVLIRCPLAKTSFAMPLSVTSISKSAFSRCTGLVWMTIPESVVSIGDDAFSGCSGLTWMSIPESVVSIGAYAFNRCSGLTSVTIPESVTSIGNSAFNSCSSLTSVALPNSLTSIGDGLFESCVQLTAVSLPASVASIGSRAFAGCTGLESVVIPEGVDRLEYGTFMGCGKLSKIVVMNPAPPLVEPYVTDGVFDGVPADALVYIPRGSFNAFRESYGWNWVGYDNFREMGAIDITLSQESVALKPGGYAGISAVVEPDWDMTVEQAVWSSSNPGVACVSEWTTSSCGINAVAPGDAVVYYTVTDGYGALHTRSCAVSVSELSGTDEAPAALESDKVDLFTLQGVALLRNASPHEINGLAPGIYIVRRGTAVTKTYVR